MSTLVAPHHSRLEAAILLIVHLLTTTAAALGRLGERLFLRVGPVRAVFDALLLNGIVLLSVWLLDRSTRGPDSAWLTYPFILDAGLLAALRLRAAPAGIPWQRGIREALVCQALLLP